MGLGSCQTVNPDGSSGTPISNCIGDPKGPSTPAKEAEAVNNEIVVTAEKIKRAEKGSDALEVRDGTMAIAGDVGFRTENGVLTAAPLVPRCTPGRTQGFQYPSGFITGSEASIGHTHNASQETGLVSSTPDAGIAGVSY